MKWNPLQASAVTFEYYTPEDAASLLGQELNGWLDQVLRLVLVSYYMVLV